MTTRIIGNYGSPFVRKVLVCLALKQVPYEIDPIVPFFGDDRFTALSPVRRIPVLIDDQITITDSTVICEYLDERYPTPPLLPSRPADRARARWLEEYADTRLGDVIIWKLFNQRVINRGIWRKPTDEAVVSEALDVELPEIMAYLETQAPADGFLFGLPSIADIAIACFFRNAAVAGWQPDATRWPQTSAWIARVLALEPFRALEPYELVIFRTPVVQQRAVLAELGAPVSAESYGTDQPRRGPMTV